MKYGKYKMKNLILFYLTAFFYSSICLFTFWGCEKYPEKIQANLNKLKSTNACSGCDLTEVKLIGFDLKNVNLSGFANLSRVDLTNANLVNGNLTGAGLTGANLTGANLTGANLTGTNLTGTNLTGTNLTGANLTGANLTGANLTGANLTEVILKGATMIGAILTDDQSTLLQTSGLLIVP